MTTRQRRISDNVRFPTVRGPAASSRPPAAERRIRQPAAARLADGDGTETGFNGTIMYGKIYIDHSSILLKMIGNNGIRRRQVLKSMAATGGVATGIASSVSVASADEGPECVEWRVVGDEDNTDYRIEFDDNLEIDAGGDTESNDSVNGNVIKGTVHAGYEDHYYTEWNCTPGYIWHAEFDGAGAIQYCGDYCDPGQVMCKGFDQVQVDVTGYGDYTFGWWRTDTSTLEAGDNIESGEYEGCYPCYTDTGDPALCCEWDPEGVVTGTVDPPDYDAYEAYFGTGEVDGYTDTYYLEDGTTEGSGYVYGNGDITLDISYQ